MFNCVSKRQELCVCCDVFSSQDNYLLDVLFGAVKQTAIMPPLHRQFLSPALGQEVIFQLIG